MSEAKARARANARLRADMLDVVSYHYEKLDEVIRDNPAASSITCRKGCNACCRQLVAGELIEADYLVEHAPDAVRRALPAFQAQENRIAEIMPRSLLDAAAGKFGPHAHGDALCEIADRWYLSDPPQCPLLGDDGLCTVYEYRPHACRHYVVTSDPAKCSDPRERVTELPGPHNQGMQAALMRTMQQARGRYLTGFLCTTVRVAWGGRAKNR